MTGQGFDLTGRWECNDGGTYFTRQVGNRVWWVGLSADNGASFTNVFEGRISGNGISGTWADVPRGALRNSGELQLRIESPNRLSGGGPAFGGTVWTRIGTAGGPAPSPSAADINGNWIDSNGYSFTVRQNGPSLAIAGPAGWAPASGSFTSATAFTITWPGRGTYSATVGTDQVTWNNGITWRRGGSGGAGGFGTAGPSPAPASPPATAAADINGNWIDSNGYSFTVRQNGPSLAIAGPAGWAPASGSFTSATAFTITWPGRGTYSATVGTDQVTWNNGITWRRGGSGGAGGFGTAGPGPSAGTAVAGGICANPRTQAMMDEWLARAIPPQPAGSALRYEPWGRLVGRSLTANVTVNGAPDTRLTRCEWLWNNAAQLRSANGLGTLKEYVESRR